MKKTLSFILSTIMVLSATVCFTGCGEKNDADTSSQTSVEETKAEETTVEETTAPEIKAGDKGTGIAVLNALYADMTIPEGVDYEVKTYGLSAESAGSMEINIGKGNSIEISTLRMVSSLEDALNEFKRTSGNDCEVTDLEDVTINDVTYKSAHVTSDYVDKYYYVYYYKNFQDRDTYVEIMYDNSKFDFARGYELTDPIMVEFLSSINYK